MLTDEIFRAASARKNEFTAAELADDLGVDRDKVSSELKSLKTVGVAEYFKDKWRLIGRRTEARDRLVHAALARAGTISRAELNALLPSYTSAQVYTSLQRLILRGQAEQLRDGSRTPHYRVVK